jgi:hypothetical protein
MKAVRHPPAWPILTAFSHDQDPKRKLPLFRLSAPPSATGRRALKHLGFEVIGGRDLARHLSHDKAANVAGLLSRKRLQSDLRIHPARDQQRAAALWSTGRTIRVMPNTLT